jgi:hypothetical protein
MLFILAIAGVSLIRYHTAQGMVCLLVAALLMWADAQSAAAPKDWLKAKKHILG